MILLDHLPHREIRPLLERGVPVYLSINPVEYHGPHLPLDTDALLSRAMTEKVHPMLGAEVTQGLPPVLAEPIAMGTNAAPGPGTIETPYGLLRNAVLARCRALAELGAKKVILTTFHGGPFHNLAIWDGVQSLKENGIPAVAPFNLLLRKLTDLRDDEIGPIVAPIQDEKAREKVRASFVDDYHAGFWETSLMLHFHKSAVDPGHVKLPPCPDFGPALLGRVLQAAARAVGNKGLEAEFRFVAQGLGWTKLRPFPGYTGNPQLANARSGEVFAELLAPLYANAMRATFLEAKPSPEPILKILKLLSLDGLLSP